MKSGGPPRSIVVGEGRPHGPPQNVTRATTVDGRLVVLQGLSHMVGAGQLAVIWREHDHFTSQVIAQFESEPIDWLALPGHEWLVATTEHIWHVRETGEISPVARLPQILSYPSSLARSSDGTLYLGGSGGVLRLTPLWKEDPRYAADWLVSKRSPAEDCWREWAAREWGPSEL